jgi:CheY-like chemotaxis protein
MDASSEPCQGVLLVDDDRDIRETVSGILEDEGYSPVLQATDGQDALLQLREAPVKPCVILLDLMMPRMDGWEFRAEQMRDRTLAHIPIVLLTANGAPRQRASALQAAGALSKPFKLDELLHAVEQFCDRKA